MIRRTFFLALVFSLGRSLWSQAVEVPIRNVVRFDTGMETQVMGHGLVIGLDGTGDSQKVAFTPQSLISMLRRFGLTVPPGGLKVDTVATVIVTATLPPFARPGMKIDATVSAVGDAQSLQGGVLLQTPLLDVNENELARAAGPLSIGGFNASAGGSSVQKNHPTVGIIPNGAVVLQEVAGYLQQGNVLTLELLYPDNSTAVRMAQAINEYLKEERAAALDPRTVAVQVPEEFRDNEMELLAAIEKLKVEVEVKAKVVLNERNGTVTVGPGVRILPVVISHGALKVEVTRIPVISQPMPFSEGQTVVESVTDVRAEEEETQIMELDGKDTIQDLVQALRALKVSSRDLIAIFQALKDAGALLAELEIR